MARQQWAAGRACCFVRRVSSRVWLAVVASALWLAGVSLYAGRAYRDKDTLFVYWEDLRDDTMPVSMEFGELRFNWAFFALVSLGGVAVVWALIPRCGSAGRET